MVKENINNVTYLFHQAHTTETETEIGKRSEYLKVDISLPLCTPLVLCCLSPRALCDDVRSLASAPGAPSDQSRGSGSD